MTTAAGKAKQTSTDKAYHAILESILSGEAPPGSALRLHDIADTLGMSVMPIREALRQLGTVGVVEITPNKGAQVRGLSSEDLIDTYRTRIALEGILCHRAAANFTPDDESAATAALEEQRQALEDSDYPAARIAHREFHYTLYRAAGSTWLLRSIEPSWLNSERYRIASEYDGDMLTLRRAEHDAMLRACAHHKPQDAQVALRTHLLTTVGHIDKSLEKRLEILTGGPCGF